MTQTWAARPTTYKGIQMRSRLEARFAARLDATHDLKWEYEPRAFADENGQYLPDFRTHVEGFHVVYIEVKPTIAHALAVLERVQIVRSSEPDAVLMVVIPDAEGQFVLLPDAAMWVWVN